MKNVALLFVVLRFVGGFWSVMAAGGGDDGWVFLSRGFFWSGWIVTHAHKRGERTNF